MTRKIVEAGSLIDVEVLDQLIRGVHTPEGKARAKAVRRLSPSRVAMILDTGLKRQIREMFKTLNHRVTKLVRVRIGSLMDPALAPGAFRPLEAPESELMLETPVRRPAKKKTAPGRPRQSPKKKTARKTSRSEKGGRPASKNGPRRPAAKTSRKRPTGRR